MLSVPDKLADQKMHASEVTADYRDVCIMKACESHTSALWIGNETTDLMVIAALLTFDPQESRPLATVPLMRECIAKDRCHVIKGKHFGPGK